MFDAFGQYGIGSYQRSDQLVGNVDFRLLEAVLQILSDRGAGYDIEEASLDVATYQAHRIGLQVVADLVFL